LATRARDLLRDAAPANVFRNFCGKEPAAPAANGGAMPDPTLEMTDGDVVAWRRRRLRSAGFPSQLADAVARDGAMDLHALLELVDRGCPPHLAARIIAPLDREPTLW
jgi:hypothetical protein